MFGQKVPRIFDQNELSEKKWERGTRFSPPPPGEESLGRILSELLQGIRRNFIYFIFKICVVVASSEV